MNAFGPTDAGLSGHQKETSLSESFIAWVLICECADGSFGVTCASGRNNVEISDVANVDMPGAEAERKNVEVFENEFGFRIDVLSSIQMNVSQV